MLLENPHSPLIFYNCVSYDNISFHYPIFRGPHAVLYNIYNYLGWIKFNVGTDKGKAASKLLKSPGFASVFSNAFLMILSNSFSNK